MSKTRSASRSKAEIDFILSWALLFSIGKLSAQEVSCPSGWKLYGSRCYFLYSIKGNEMDGEFENSKKICDEMSAIIASPRSSEEKTFLESMFQGESLESRTVEFLRLGLVASKEEETGNMVWKYQDGTYIRYRYWRHSDEDKLSSLTCSYLDRNPQYPGIVRSNCSAHMPFICKKCPGNKYGTKCEKPCPDESSGCVETSCHIVTGLCKKKIEATTAETAVPTRRTDEEEEGEWYETINILRNMTPKERTAFGIGTIVVGALLVLLCIRGMSKLGEDTGSDDGDDKNNDKSKGDQPAASPGRGSSGSLSSFDMSESGVSQSQATSATSASSLTTTAVD